MVLNGRIGQVIGPFTVNEDLLADGGVISEFTPEVTHPVLTKVGIQTTPYTNVKINGYTIRIGKTGIYELEDQVGIQSLIFLDSTDDKSQVDFVY